MGHCFNQKENVDSYYEQILVNHFLLHRWASETHGMNYIMSGMGYKPIGHELHKHIKSFVSEQDKVFFDRLYRDWRNHVKTVEDYVKSLPTTTEFLKTHIYNYE